jgi:hypothetical protein
VAEFLVEVFVSQADPGAAESGARRARAAADELTREGMSVRYLRSIFVPEDETCFYLYEAGSIDAVREAAQRAALPYVRVVGAVTSPGGGVR